MRKKLNKAECAEVLAKMKKAVKAGRVVIGNKAVTEKKSPHISVYKYDDGVRDDGTKYKAAQGFVLQWGEPGRGFGEITFSVKKDGSVELQTECMGREFVIDQLVKMVTNAKLEE